MRTYTPDQIANLTGAARGFALEVDAMEAERDAKLAQDSLPSIDAATQQEATPTTVVEESDQEPLVKTELPQDETKDINYWRKKAEEKAKEAETWHKRQADAKRALTPAQEEAAALRKENESLLSKLDEMSRKLESLSERLDSRDVSQEPDDDDFEEVYPDIAKKMSKIQEEAIRKAIAASEERVKKLELSSDKIRKMEERFEEEQRNSAMQKHFMEIKAIHQDAESFFNDVHGPAFNEWADHQPDYIGYIVQNPMSVSGRSFADVITRFKNDVGLSNEPKKPSLGDRVNKVTSSPNVPVSINDDPRFLSDEEMLSIDEMIRRNSRNPDVVQELLERHEKTLARNMKLRK